MTLTPIIRSRIFVIEMLGSGGGGVGGASGFFGLVKKSNDPRAAKTPAIIPAFFTFDGCVGCAGGLDGGGVGG